MELFPIFYACAFLILAGAGCAFCWSFNVLRQFAAQAFVAILAFGAASFIGLMLVESTPIGEWLNNKPGGEIGLLLA
jgi:hypothetical protein